MALSFALSAQIVSMLTTKAGATGFETAYLYNQVQAVSLSGRNPAVGTSGLCDIWGYPNIASGQPVRVLPSAAYTIAVISDSVNDVMTSGTGAWTVAVSYLDSNYLPHVAVYQLNGQTAVTVATTIDGGTGGTVTNALRQNDAEILSTGTGLVNAGNIYVCDSTNTFTAGVPQTTTKTFDCILIGDNISSTSCYTIPAGYSGALFGLLHDIADTTSTAKYGKYSLGFTTGSNNVFLHYDLGGLSSAADMVPISMSALGAFPIFQPKSEIRLQAQASATTEVSSMSVLIMWPNALQTA